jgi:hypothetical protein
MTVNGKETECMTITRKRGGAAAPRDASTGKPKAAAEAQEPLLRSVGNWNAKMISKMAGQAETTEKGTENVIAICEGRWTWSDFRGSMMGQQFEGHSLIGYDPIAKQYVGFWIESPSPTLARIDGKYDAGKKEFTLDGKSTDPTGKPMTIHQVCTQTDDNTRKTEMTFECSQGPSTLKIEYERAK